MSSRLYVFERQLIYDLFLSVVKLLAHVWSLLLSLSFADFVANSLR